MTDQLKIELVDDHEIVRQGLRAMIDAEDDLTVVGEAGTVEEAIRRVGFDEPNIVLLDVRLPDGSGVEACREIRARWPEINVLMLTSFADDEALFSSIMAGARLRGSRSGACGSTTTTPRPRGTCTCTARSRGGPSNWMRGPCARRLAATAHWTGRRWRS